MPLVVAVHGGAGAVPTARRPRHIAGCEQAAAAAFRLLEQGGTALDAVVAAVACLEDDPVFNAGTGASLTAEGTLEFDAAVMEGERLEFGGVCVLPPFRNPIRIARAALEEPVHRLFAAEGARALALRHGFEPADAGSMITDAARTRLAKAKDSGVSFWAGGTVGAVALGRDGDIAAATSTGGTVGKSLGRVGDSPLPGAGTWADRMSAACSATGSGEEILRFGLARHAAEAADRMGAQPGAEHAVQALEARVQGRAGLILITRTGDVGIARNTKTMSFAVAREGETVEAGD